MTTVLDAYSSAIADLCTRYMVRKLEVFGSAARVLDFDSERSDFDFAVEFMPMTPRQHFDAYFDLLAALEQLLGRPVDLVELHAAKNPVFLKAVAEEKQALYVAA
jgi:predicted nucleotidyltransferase